ncbi:Candidapepsin [Meyerozyma sp. JA9]|nr:Candidapepsin [Meyerozyma sp. JA9]
MYFSPLLISAAATLFAACTTAAAVPDTLNKRSTKFLELDFDVIRNTTDAESLGLRRRSDVSSRTLYNKDGYYITYVYIGSNQQKIGVDIDTGSSDLWVPDVSSGCVYNSCQYGEYDPSQSTTSQNLNEPFSIRYGDNSTADGSYYLDTVALGTCDSCPKVKDVQFASATNNTAGFGVFGIGFTSNEATWTEYPNFIESLRSQGFIDKRAYSLYLNEQQAATGTIIFGGKDLAKIDGDLVTLPIVAETRLSVKLDSVTINGKTIETNTEALIDSGTSLAEFVPDLADAIFANYPGAFWVKELNVYITDCSADPNLELTFNFDGISFKQTLAEAWATNIASKTKFYGCGFQIGRSEINVLGDLFMRNAYTVFDYDANTISLAHVKYTNDKDVVVIT